jgi:16S rRNA (cytosine1402-N4)-methyltransferase
MEATTVLDSVKHYPVLLKEIISVITPQHGGTFIVKKKFKIKEKKKN